MMSQFFKKNQIEHLGIKNKIIEIKISADRLNRYCIKSKNKLDADRIDENIQNAA